MKTIRTTVTALLLLGAAAQAQNYSINWFKISGGGGTSAGGTYSLNGTIGQHDAGGPSASGTYSLTGGFWAIYAVQGPGPTLTITRSGANVVISWPSPSTGYVLQQNSNIADPNGWTNFGGTVNDNGAIKSVTITSPAGNVYYRLKKSGGS